MEFLSFDSRLGHFFIRDHNTVLVSVIVQYRLNRLPFGLSGVGNQVDYRVQADERPTSPVLGLVKRCSMPVTGFSEVDMVVTEVGVF